MRAFEFTQSEIDSFACFVKREQPKPISVNRETIRSFLLAIQHGGDPMMLMTDIEIALEDGELTAEQARKLKALASRC